jgi:hypothetical protein
MKTNEIEDDDFSKLVNAKAKVGSTKMKIKSKTMIKEETYLQPSYLGGVKIYKVIEPNNRTMSGRRLRMLGLKFVVDGATRLS